MRLKSIFLSALLLACAAGWAQPTNKSSKVIKVLSFNILHGATMKGDYNLDVIADIIIKADPDFVAMQEVDFHTNRSRQYDLITMLGLKTKMIPLFAKAIDYDGGAYGIGILSKYTFLKTRNLALPFTPGVEHRTSLEIVTILPSGDTIAVVDTHLDHSSDQDRMAQAKKINEVFSNNRYPTILAGDLNAEPGSAAITILEERWFRSYDPQKPQPTFPSSRPARKIDYVMFRPQNKWKVLDEVVIQNGVASDHCALLVTLQLVE